MAPNGFARFLEVPLPLVPLDGSAARILMILIAAPVCWRESPKVLAKSPTVLSFEWKDI